MKSKLNLRRKAIEPLIAAILLIVVAVILITIVLSWGKMFTTKSLEKVETLELNKSDVEHFIYPKKTNSDAIQFVYSPPISENFGEVKLKSYKILYGSEETEDINLSIEHSLNAGLNIINISNTSLDPEIDFSSKVTLILKTTDGYYITLKNISFENLNSNSSGESEEDSGATESIVDANLPYVMFGDSKLYIQPSGSNTNDGLGDADEYFDLCDYDEVTYNCIPDGNFPAKEYCEDLNAHGYDDWYLPSISQLAAIFESYIYDEDDDCMELWKGAKNTTVECINNAISETYVGEFVPLTDDDYYMSSTDYGLSSFFNLYLYYGHLNILSAGFNNYARCVRDDLPEEIVLTGDANLPYVKFGDSKLYIQPSGSNAIDGTGTDDITLNFENAKQFCSDLNAHGYDDWYVPSNTQWSAIIEAYKYDANDECLDSYGDVSNECINAEISKTYSGNLVNIKDAFYWSRTYADTYSNFYVDLDRLETNSDYFFEDESVYVRCVRDDNDLYVEPEPVILNPDTNLPYILGRDSKLLYIQPTDGPGKLNWVAAKSYCEDLNLNNYTDWYLPYNSQLEMMWHSCPDSEKTTSCMNGVIGATNDNFVNLKDSDSDYWSSTDNGETMAYKINMATGYTGIVYSSGEYNYRCVRDQ